MMLQASGLCFYCCCKDPRQCCELLRTTTPPSPCRLCKREMRSYDQDRSRTTKASLFASSSLCQGSRAMAGDDCKFSTDFLLLDNTLPSAFSFPSALSFSRFRFSASLSPSLSPPPSLSTPFVCWALKRQLLLGPYPSLPLPHPQGFIGARRAPRAPELLRRTAGLSLVVSARTKSPHSKDDSSCSPSSHSSCQCPSSPQLKQKVGGFSYFTC